MPRWRVKANNAVDPTAPRSMVPAIAPPYAPTPFSVHGGLVRLAAAPGTVPIRAPQTPGTNQRSQNRAPNWGPSGAVVSAPNVGDMDLRPGDVAPNAFLPRLFIQFSDNMQPPVRWACTNELPIPAGNYVRLPQIASKTPPRIGGTGTIPAPRVFTRWPSIVPSVPSSD